MTQLDAHQQSTAPSTDRGDERQLDKQRVNSENAPSPVAPEYGLELSPNADDASSSVYSQGATDAGQSSRTSSRQSRNARNLRRSSTEPATEYDVPESYHNLDEVSTQPPFQNPDEREALRRAATQGKDDDLGRTSTAAIVDDEDEEDKATDLTPDVRQTPSRTRRWSQSSSASAREAREARNARRRSKSVRVDYNAPEDYANLAEVADVSPVQNLDEDPVHRMRSLEESRSRDQEYIREQRLRRRESAAAGGAGVVEDGAEEKQPDLFQDGLQDEDGKGVQHKVSRLATQIYTISYLILFSLLGTLARLGLQALTTYPGTPILFPSIWPNFAGSLVMGFLAEDRMLFQQEWGTPTYANKIRRANRLRAQDEESGGTSTSAERVAAGLAAAKKAHAATKKTIPLYIGLATGFCGSFTSFSAFIRDMFLATSNDLAYAGTGDSATVARNGGYSFMALLAVLLATVCLSIGGLVCGAHLAIAVEPITPSLPYNLTRKLLDRLAVLLGWGCWLGAVLLAIWPPDRSSSGPETWRGSAVFALVLAPLGTLARFYTSLHLNGRLAAFPLGTFAVNVVGTGILAMGWDLAHAGYGGVIGCQVLQGLEDGFCGCLTTVSTWVAELTALRRRHAYFYGGMSVAVAYAVVVAVMGGVRWSEGWGELQCVH